MDNVPSGWKDDGHTLVAPNGHKVVDGFRAYVLANNWDASNEPIENECHVSQLEAHNPGLGAGQRQLFVYDMLYWTPATNVKRSSVGLELQAYNSIVGALQAHIAQQQLQLQKAYDTAPLAAPTASTVNVDELAAVLIDLRDSKSDAINAVSVALKAACQKALADIGK